MPRLAAHGPSLQATALWYPTIPSPNLCLKDTSFTGESPSTAGYQPLFWTHFGGPNGIYLRSLTEVCVTGSRSLWSIDFHYATEDTPTEARKLGRGYFTEFSHVTRFPIDGPGGELIQTIDVSIKRVAGKHLYNFYKHGKLSSFKVSNFISNLVLIMHRSQPLIFCITGVIQITTNRGRSVYFQPQIGSRKIHTLVPLSIAPGTTLTGFYASQVRSTFVNGTISRANQRYKHPGVGLISLGAISEVID